jgi:hypothetical protein
MKPVLPRPKENRPKCPSGCFLVDGSNIARTTLQRCQNSSRGRSMMCGKCGMLINDDTIAHSCGNPGRRQSSGVSWDVSGMSMIKTTIDWKLGHIDVTTKTNISNRPLILAGHLKQTTSLSSLAPRNDASGPSRNTTTSVPKHRIQPPIPMSELLLLGDIPPTSNERMLRSSQATLFPSTIPGRLLNELLNGHSVEPLVELPRLRSSGKGSKMPKDHPKSHTDF